MIVFDNAGKEHCQKQCVFSSEHGLVETALFFEAWPHKNNGRWVALAHNDNIAIT